MEQKDLNKDVERICNDIFQHEEEPHRGHGKYHHEHRHYRHRHHHSGHRHRRHHHSSGRKIKRFFRKVSKTRRYQVVFLAVSICLVVVTLFALKYVESKTNADREQLYAQYQEQYQVQQGRNKEINSVIEEYIPGVVCWGDSLTYSGYPGILEELIDERIFSKSDESVTKITVSNEGVWGETSAEIAARCGAIPYVVSKSIYIPGEVMEIPVKIGVLGSTNNGENVKFTKGVSYKVKLNGIEGYLKPASNQVDGNFHVFVRKEAGESISVEKGTVIYIANNQKNYTNHIPVIFMGENGGWDNDPSVLIKQINAMIAHIGNLHERYIVVGLHTGTAESRKELEDAMEREYGNNYINLREYICSKGYEDLGIIPSEDELGAMKLGVVPSTLLVDGLHYGGVAKKMVATAVFNRMDELGYFDEVRSSLAN